MALIARILKSVSNKLLDIANKDLEPNTFVGVCKCPNCNEMLEVRDVNGRPLK